MLETDNPYMFGSSTTTTTTTTTTANTTANQPLQPTPPPPSSSAPTSSFSSTTGNNSNNTIQQTRPMQRSTNYHIGKTEKDDYYHKPPRINPTFTCHLEETLSQSITYANTYNPTKPVSQNTSNTVYPQNEPESSNNYIRRSVEPYLHQQHIKREALPNVLPGPPLSTFMKTKKAEEPDWYERENKSHRPTAITTATALSATTSAEVSTLETGDNKKIKRRKEMTHTMEELNKDFLRKRESLYSDKMYAVNQELKDAHQDKHPSYLEGLRDLESMRRQTIDEGILLRKYQNEVTDNQFQLEIYQAEEEYTAEIQDIREKLFASLDEKRRKLKEEKDNCDLAYDVILESQARLHKRNLRKREKEHPENKSNKKKQLTGPALVFKLKDEDILSDIQAMRSGSSSTSNTAAASAPPKKTNSSNKKK